MDEIERPDLSDMSSMELVMLMGQCARSDDPSDKQFAKFCRDEIAKRKPTNQRDAANQLHKESK